MKKQFICLLSALSIFSLVGCNKNNEEYQLITNNSIKYLAFNSEQKVAMVVGYDEKLGSEVTIPSSINGYTVNAIRRGSFIGANITKVTIPESVVYIGEYSFTKCTNLKSISLPNSLYYVGSSTFYGCSSLNDIDISNTQLKTISSYCFASCESLTNIKLNDIIAISSGAFYGCSSLIDIALPDSLVSIDNYAFNACSNLDKIFIPESVQYIGSSVFSNNKDNFKILLGTTKIPELFDNNFNCYYPYVLGTNRSTNIKDVFITNDNLDYAINNYQTSEPSASLLYSTSEDIETLIVPSVVTFQDSKNANVTSIADHAFIGDNKIQTLNLNNASNLTTIGKYAFADSSLSKIAFNTNIKILDTYSFSNCKNLKTIDLSNTVDLDIKHGAFYYDYNLETVALPSANDNATQIGTGAFYKCRQLNTLTNLDMISELNLEGYTFAECYNLGKDSNNPFIFSSNIQTLYPTDFLDWGTTQSQYIRIAKDAYTIDESGDVYLKANDGTIQLEKVTNTTYKNNLYFSNATITLEAQQ